MLFKTLISLVLLYSCAAILPPRRRYGMTGLSLLPPVARPFRSIARSRPYPILPQTRRMTILGRRIAPRTGIHSRFHNVGSSRYGRGRYRLNDYDDRYNRFDDYDRSDRFDSYNERGSLSGYNSRGYNSNSRGYNSRSRYFDYSNYRDNDRYDRDRYDRYNRYDRYDDDYNYRRPYMSRSMSGRGFGGFSMTQKRRPTFGSDHGQGFGGRGGRFNRYEGGYGYDDDND